MKTDNDIYQIAYAKALCKNGLKFFIIHGPLAWFILLYLGFILCAWIVKRFLRPVNELILGFIGLIVFSIILSIFLFKYLTKLIFKWDLELTEYELDEVNKIQQTITPFRDITSHIVFTFFWLIIFSLIAIYFKNI